MAPNQQISAQSTSTHNNHRPRAQLTIHQTAAGKVATIFLHGTCSDNGDGQPNPATYSKGELISLLEENIHDLSIKQDICEPGPGSDDWAKNYTIFPDDQSYFRPLRRWLDEKLGHGAGDYPKGLQVALGYGIEENVEDTIRHLLLLNLDEINNINITGWSRGAAAAFRLAYEMHRLAINLETDAAPLKIQKQKLKEKTINIFAVEPVPGIFRSDESNRQITPNVKNAVCLYARNEKSIGFSPVVPQIVDPTQTHCIMLLFPGHHATLVGNHGLRFPSDPAKMGYPPGQPNLPQVGFLVCWMAKTFLATYGTRFKENFDITNELSVYRNYFEQISIDMKAGKYTKLEEETYTTKQLFGQFRKVLYHLNTWFERMLSDVPEVIPD